MRSFNVLAVIVPTEARWARFRMSLSGGIGPQERWASSGARAARGLLVRGVRLARGLTGDCRVGSRRHIKTPDGRLVPVWCEQDVNCSDFREKVQPLRPELFVSAAYPQIFSPSLLRIPCRGSINFHPSLLPRYRGAHPHFWAIAKGETETGLTAHYMEEKIDTGDIIAQRAFSIEDDNYRQVYKKLVDETPAFVEMVAQALEEGIPPVPQDLAAGSLYRNDRDIDHRIFWNLHTSSEIRNLVRTLAAFAFFRDKKYVLTDITRIANNRNLRNGARVEAGTIVDIGREGLVVATVDGLIVIRATLRWGRSASILRWVRRVHPVIGEIWR